MVSLSLMLSVAQGANVVVETAVPVEVRLDAMPVVKTFGPAEITLPDVPAGRQFFTIFRDGNGVPFALDVPEEGDVRLMIGSEAIESAAAAPLPVDEGKMPEVEFRAAAGQEFTLVIDGKRRAVVGHHRPLQLGDLSKGQHTLEVRSADNLVVWLKGALELRAGDEIVLSLREGRMAEVFGRKEAWIPDN